MDVRLEVIGTTLVVKIDGEIDHHNTAKIKAEIEREMNLNNIVNLILDFDGVTFMDSSGIGMIMGRYKKVQKLGGRVIISSATPQIKRIIEMAGLHGIMQVTPDVKRALKKL